MKKKVVEQIDNIVAIIYSIDKVNLDQAFVELIDCLVVYIEQEQLINDVELNEILLSLQNAYSKKDLVELADVLLYELKEFVENIDISM